MPLSLTPHRSPSRIAGLWGLACLAACSQSPLATKPAAPVAATALETTVLQIEPCRWPRLARGQGSLVADETAVVGAKVAGRIADVRVDLGDVVAADAELVSLDREDLRLQIAQVEALLSQSRAAVGLPADAPVESLNPLNSPPVREAQAVLDEARTKRTRLERLRSQNALTETELQQVQAAEKVADAQLSSALNAVNEKIALIRVRSAELAVAKQRYADAVTVAPFAGMVLARHVAPGTYVQVGDSLVTLVQADPLRYQGTLPERFARELRIGQEVRLDIDSAAGPQTAKITRISPSLNAASRALMFEADVENKEGRLRAGLFAEADVVLDPRQQAIAVPAEAIVEFAGTEKVWKVVDGQCVEQPVRTGARRGELVEITDGLTTGDVILPQGRLGRPGSVSVTATERIAGADGSAIAEGVELGASDDAAGAHPTCDEFPP